MIRVGVSGAGGRMGTLVCEAVAAQPDLELTGTYDPFHASDSVAGLVIGGEPDVLADCDVVVEFTNPDVVVDNLEQWRSFGCHVVFGTSGFTAGRIDEVRESWGSGPPNCLIVPNFSIGAVLMMRFAELAASHFAAAEVIELHHDRKADAPSGTAIATADRIASAHGHQTRAVESTQTVAGARGGDVSGVPVHSIRLPGLLAHQEVLFGNPGEVLTIRHDSTDRVSFLPGVLLAVRNVGAGTGVAVGLGGLLGLGQARSISSDTRAPQRRAAATTHRPTLVIGRSRFKASRAAPNARTTQTMMSTGHAKTRPPAREAKSPETGPPAP